MKPFCALFLASTCLPLNADPGTSQPGSNGDWALAIADTTAESRILLDSGRSTGTVSSDAPDGGAEELAKKLANPVANLISVPVQGNVDFGIGPRDAIRSTTNIQPVIPFALNEEWNLISRTILPVIYAEEPVAGFGNKWGLGDTVQSLFLSPASSDPIWGIGPVFLVPTATSGALGANQFGLGPTGVVLKQQGPWTYGGLANHIWGLGGSDDPEVNLTFLQPFLSYTTPDAWTFTLNSETTYNWDSEEWTVPINVVVSKLVTIGKQPVSLIGGVRYYAESPEGGPDWGIRFGFTLLFPKG